MSDRKMTGKTETDNSHETTLTYVEWVNGILEQHEILPNPPIEPEKKRERPAA